MEETLEILKELSPGFISVTYGALGSSQDKTISIVRKIKKEMGMEVMSHFTCIGLTEEKVDDYLRQLREAGLDNILALRGDVPQGMPREIALQGAYQYANDLVTSIRKKTGQYFGIAVAGYPESHLEAKSLEADIEHLKLKVDAGADFIVTQLFYDNQDFYRYRDLVVKKGITVPIVPGIMPIQSVKQIAKITKMCGAKLTPELNDFFCQEESLSREAQLDFGIDYAIRQCRDLLEHGAPGIHFYTLNRSKAVRAIYLALNSGK